MSANLFFMPFSVALDTSGDPISGAKLYAYQAGTLTAEDTYTDVDLTVAHTNPVIADAAGRFAPIYLQNISYRFILKDASDVEIDDIDDVNSLPTTFGSGGESKSGNYTIVIADRGKFFEFTAVATVDLPTLAAAGAGFPVAILNTSTANVTIDPGASTINGAASLVLYPGGWAIVTSGSAEWKAVYQEGVESGTFPAAITGFAADLTPTVAYVRDGKQVNMYVNAGSQGTSTTNAMTMTGVPAQLRPTSTVNEITRLVDNSVAVVGIAAIASTGTITFGNGITGTTFTASGSKGLPGGWSLSFTLN